MDRGGPVMWPLLGLSLIAATLVLERIWFWTRHASASARAEASKLAWLIRNGERDRAKTMVDKSQTLYAEVVEQMLDADRLSPAVAAEAVEQQRSRIDRFMPTLSTIITAAPLLGILGTVIGIIASFELLSDSGAVTDPRAVSAGIAEALITTAAGLVVAIVVLFPFNAFRAQVDRALGRMETLMAAAEEDGAGDHSGTERATSHEPAPGADDVG